jgi:hypothetical protein
MVVDARCRSRLAVFAFLAIIVSSSTLLPAQSRLSSGKTTYKTVGTAVAQAPAWTPTFEPPRAAEEGQSLWNQPNSPSSAPAASPPTMTDSPFAFDEPSLMQPDTGPFMNDPNMAPEIESWGLDQDACGYGGDGAPAPVYSTGTWFWRGDWFSEQGFAWWTVEDPRANAIAVDPAIQTVFTTKDVSFRFAPGAKLSLGRMLGRDAGNRDHMWELTFVGLFEWESRLDIGTNNLNTLDTVLNPGSTVVGFSDANSQTYMYEANYDSLEWNYRVNTRPGRDQMAMQPDGSWVRFKNTGTVSSVFGGMRLIMLGETVDYSSEVVDPNMTTDVVQSGTYIVRTNNDLFGPQLGFEHRDTYDEWGWGLRTKLGGLVNLIGRRSGVTIDDFGDVTTRGERTDQEQFSFLADVGIFGHYQLRPNLFLRLGYDVVYLTGLSLAPENLGLGPEFPVLNSSGDNLYHGGTVSFETLW